MMMIKEKELTEQQSLARGLANAPDAFDYIYECISGNHGDELWTYVCDLYQDVSIDNGLHPDDHFEEIINIILDDLEAWTLSKPAGIVEL